MYIDTNFQKDVRTRPVPGLASFKISAGGESADEGQFPASLDTSNIDLNMSWLARRALRKSCAKYSTITTAMLYLILYFPDGGYAKRL
jgi:hypothetical protein